MAPDQTQESLGGAAERSKAGQPATTKGTLTPAMRAALIAVSIIAAAGLLIAIWLFTTGGGAPGVPGASSASPTATHPPTPGPSPGATPTTGSEVHPPSPTAPTETPGSGLPPLPTSAPLVADPLPRSASATSELVHAFPASIMGPAPKSDVVSNSIATEGKAMQVTLVARTDASADDIRAHYQELWARLGLTASGSAGSDLAYSDSFTALSLAFSSSSGTGTLYTVYGVFRTS